MDANDDIQKHDKARVGYSTAIALVTYEGQLIWRAFSAMLAANGIILAVSGIVFNNNNFLELKFLSPILSTLGLIITIAWFLGVRRMFAFYRYWFAWARHFEDRFLTPVVQITTMGRTYSEGGSILREGNLDIPRIPRFGWAARTFRLEILLIIVIIVFGIIHAAMLTVFTIKYFRWQ